MDRQVRVVHVRQAYGIGAKIQVQERLLGLAGRVPRVVYAREHALVRRLVRLEDEYAGVEDQLEARIAVHVRDRAEREGHVEELVKILSREGVRVDVDDAVDPQEVVERPEVQLGVLIDEAVADAGAVVRWRDALDLEELPACCAHDAEGAGGEMTGVEEDAAGIGADGLERVAERRCGYGVQVIVERGNNRPRVGMRRVRSRRPCGKSRFPGAWGVSQIVEPLWRTSTQHDGEGVHRYKRRLLTVSESHPVALWFLDGTVCTG